MAKTKIDIISGFLGAGKTTFIKKLLEDSIKNEKTILVENEFGEIGIDGGFLKNSGIEIREMNSGCICCSLVGDFSLALKEILTKYEPDRIIIEPSGVGKLSDVIKAVTDVESELEVSSNTAITVVDVKKCKLYMKNFGEFFNDQIKNAKTIVLSRTDIADNTKTDEAISLIRGINDAATIISTPISELSGEKLLEILENPVDLKTSLMNEFTKEQINYHEHGHHHGHGESCGCIEHGHHHEHGENCGCTEHGHHHEHGESCGCTEHGHHHGHGENCGCTEHEHHHEHGENCGCTEHVHHHEHGESCGCTEHEHHHANDFFTSWGLEQVPAISRLRLENILDKFANTKEFGTILRAKGMLKDIDTNEWIYFDMVPGEIEVRKGEAENTGKVCVIGTELDEEALKKEFKS